MKPFFLLLLLIASGILFEFLSRPLGYPKAIYQCLQRVPALFKGRWRNALPAAGPFGPFRRPFAEEHRRPAAQL